MSKLTYKIFVIFSVVVISAPIAAAGTEYLSKGHYMLGVGVGGILDPYILFGTDQGVTVTFDPEFGYFFVGPVAAVTVLQYRGVWDFDPSPDGERYYSHLQWSGGAEADVPLHRLFALYNRFTAGIDYDPDDGDVYPIFMPAVGGKVFLAPQTPLWFGYRYQGLVERYESGTSHLRSYHGIIFGLQVLW
jgi:hypothetical protein